MRNSRILFLLLAPSMIMGEIATESKPSESCHHLNSSMMIGGNYSRLNLEPDEGGSLNGNLGGAHALYEYRPENCFYGALGFYWRQGSLEGSGGSQTLLDLKAVERMGYTIEYNPWHCSLYTGFGFRYLSHDLETFNKSSLKLNYYEFYVPVGFASEYSFNSVFSLGLNFEWMPQVFPTVQIRPLGGAFWSLTHKIANFLVEVPFIFKIEKCRSWIIVVNPFYERWQDGHTTAKTSRGTPLGLPGNTYNFYGADLNVIYSF